MSATNDQVEGLRKELDDIKADIGALRQSAGNSHDATNARVDDIIVKCKEDVKYLRGENDERKKETDKVTFDFNDPKGRLKAFEIQIADSEISVTGDITEMKSKINERMIKMKADEEKVKSDIDDMKKKIEDDTNEG